MGQVKRAGTNGHDLD